jgi:diguanylate cyclase (GGDEF)-like protein
MKIIVAEDDLVAGAILTKALKQFGHEPLLFKNGRDALEAFKEEPTRIVISDWMMPALTGLEFCQAIRQLRLPEYTHFILQTANTSQEHFKVAMEAQVDDFFRKPVVKSELQSRLIVAERMIAQHEAAQHAMRELARFPEENPNPVLQLSRKGRLIYANPAGTDILSSWGLALGLQAPEELQRLVHELIESGTRQSIEQRSGDRTFSFAATSAHRDGTTYVYGHDITERLAAEQQIIRLRDEALHRSQHDQLTGLPNRALLAVRRDREMERTRNTGSPFALLVVDIDNFKSVNDGLGHQVGDDVIQTVASSLGQNVREDDTVCRWGGDEFVLLLRDATDSAAVGSICERLAQSVKESIARLKLPVPVSLSIGSAVFPKDSEDVDTLMQQADQALYDAKAAGRDCWREFKGFSKEGQTKSSDNLFFLLNRAVADKRLDVHFQPLVRATTGRVVSFEALVRWNEPALGWIGPDQFIPLAEEKGLIGRIGRQVVDRSLEQLALWRRDQPDLQVSVNVSRPELQRVDCAAQYLELVNAHALPPSALILEITEREAFAENSACRASLERLFEAGFRLSLDDFGSGYSTFELLCDLPFHELKLNKELVQRVHTDRGARIVQSIVELGRRLNMVLVAEGIETAGQRDFLKELGVQKFQGYFFARPLDGTSATEYLVTSAEALKQTEAA